MEKLQCGCKITEEGYYYSECKYHQTHCHFHKCSKKTLNGERYCKEHQEYYDNQPGDIEGYGGSDF